MSKEGIEYARALTGELRRLHERNEAVDRQRQMLVQEYDRVYDKLLGMLRDLGQPLVVDGMLYQLSANGSITDQPVIVDGSPPPAGRGYYQPSTQSVVTWHRLSDRPPAQEQVVVLVRPRSPSVVWLATYLGESWDAEGEDDLWDTDDDDLWAELPLPPRAML